MSARVEGFPTVGSIQRKPGLSGAPAQVFINGRFLSQKIEGVQRAAEEIVRALDGLICDGLIDPGQWQITVLAPPDILRTPLLSGISVRVVGRMRGHAWEQSELPWHARGGVLLSLCNAAPVLKSRHVAALYDAAVFAAPAGYSWTFATWYRLLFRSLGQTARTILTSSEFSARELRRHAAIPEDKLKVIRLGGEHLTRTQADEAVLDRYALRGEPFVLTVGSRNPNKNFRAVLAAMEHYSTPRPVLVVAGGSNDRVFRDDSVLVPGERVVHTGYVSDAELKALYSTAAAFVLPSLYEGFGFPPLEAMACGCPAVVSDIPVLRELCGDAAEYFDPLEPRSIAAAVRQVLQDPQRARDLRSCGFRRLQRFRWDRCAADVWEAVTRAADRPSGRPP